MNILTISSNLYLWIIISVILFILIMTIIISLAGLKICFYSSRKQKYDDNKVEICQGEKYEPYYDQMEKDIAYVINLPKKYVSIKSRDGLTLCGKYFEFKKGAPIELMVHGYRGNSKRDLSTGVIRAMNVGRNVFLIDHRACGLSEGKYITFGVKECIDVLDWINYIIENIDKDAKIFLTGVSMGAATVMNCSGMELPKNVVAILADCGYTSPKDILIKVMKDQKLPARFFYPFIRLAAKVICHFSVNSIQPVESLKKCKLPIIFIHGKADSFVPYEMSIKCYEACASKNKKLLLIDDAEHAISFLTNPLLYLNELETFFSQALEEK